MNFKHVSRHLTGAAAAVLLSLPLTAQDLDLAKVEEVMKKYGTPGKEHKALASWVGTWKVDSTYWMQPGMPPMKSTGTAKFRLLMKGRYLNEQFRSKSPEMGIFSGRGTLAYDLLAKEYVHTWIDSMGTGVMISRGRVSEDGKSIVLRATQKDPMTMQDVQFRSVSYFGSPEKRKMEMFVTYPGKPEYKLMEITYEKQEEAEGGAVIGGAVGAIIGGVVEPDGEREDEGRKKKE